MNPFNFESDLYGKLPLLVTKEKPKGYMGKTRPEMHLIIVD
jgi:hypothetical protein